MKNLARYMVLAAALAACFTGEDDDMALPASRDLTFTPLSPVPSAVLNDIQDAVIAVNTGYHAADAADNAALAARIGASGALTMPLAPIAPDYRISVARDRYVDALSGVEQVVGEWTHGSGDVRTTVAAPGAYFVPLVVESGETITVIVALSQSVAVAGGTVSLQHVDQSGTPTVVGSPTAIANATGGQILTICTLHATVPLSSYRLVFSFAAGGGTRLIQPPIRIGYLR